MLLGNKVCQLSELVHFDKNLLSVPPTQTYTPMMGKFTLLIKLDYLNLPFQKNFQYRYSIWGYPHKIIFEAEKSSLKITASLESLSKYLWDMNILCIQIVSILDSKQANPMSNTMRKKSSNQILERQKRVVGYTYIPLRKYFINHVINSFASQKFVVVDQNKKRLGELGVQLRVEMIQNNGVRFKQYFERQNSIHDANSQNLYSNSQNYQDQISSSRKQATNRVSCNEEALSSLRKQKKVTIAQDGGLAYPSKNIGDPYIMRNDQYKQVQKDLVQKKYSKKNYFNHQDLYLGPQMSYKQIVNEIQNDEEETNLNKNKEFRKPLDKGAKSQQYIFQKPQHTDLSLFRMRWGPNYPSLQLMKLRLDEVKYLENKIQNTAFSSQTNEPIKELKLILKDLVSVSGKISSSQAKFISISYLTADSKLVSKSELNLQNMPKNSDSNSIVLNHLMVLNNPIMTDRLVIQTLETKDQISIKDFINHLMVDLRKKDNKKRYYELKYNAVFESINRQTSIHKEVKGGQMSEKTEQIQKSKDKTKKTKQINKIINKRANQQKEEKRGKQLGPKNMIAQRQNGQKAPSQLKSPINKLLISSSVNSKPDQLVQKQPINHLQCLSSAMKYFQLMYDCEEQSCFEVVIRLTNEKCIEGSLRQKLYNKIQGILFGGNAKSVEYQYSLQQIINNLFQSNFQQFYEAFLSYKEINQRYETILAKLTKALSANFQTQQDYESHIGQCSLLNAINSILQYIKKYRKNNINFGLIKMQNLLSIILEKVNFKAQRQTKDQDENNIQNEDIQNLNNLNNQNKQHNRNKSADQHNLNIDSQMDEKKKSQKQEDIVQLQQIRNLDQKQITCVHSFLRLFSRYQQEFIKLSQLQSFIRLTWPLDKKKSSLQNPSKHLNANLGILLGIYRQVKFENSAKRYNTFIESKICQLLQKNHQHLPFGNQAGKLTDISLYELIFQEPLQISDIKSSIHFGLSNLQSQIPDLYSPRSNQQRLSTQQQGQQKQSKKGTKFGSQDIRQFQKQRLNTEESNLIRIVNNNREAFPQRYTQIGRQDQTIDIEITRRQQFIIEDIKYDAKDKQTQDFRQPSRLVHRSEVEMDQKRPATQFISISYEFQNLFFVGLNGRPLSQITHDTTLIYRCEQTDQKDECKMLQFKLNPLQDYSKFNIVPNCFSKDDKTLPKQFLNLKLLNFQNQGKITSTAQKDQNHLVQIKNLMGLQQYPIENSQGKILFILKIQIEEVDYTMKQFQQERISQGYEDIRSSQKTNHFLILNVNRLICLDPFEAQSHFRFIYENSNGQIFVRNIDQRNMLDQKNTKNIMQRVLQLNISNIKLKFPLNSSQKNYLRIFKVTQNSQKKQEKQPNELKDFQNEQIKVPNVFSNKKSMVSKNKNSFPVSRKYINHETHSQIPVDDISCDLMCQFQFTFKRNKNESDIYGINKVTKWLVDEKFRLQIELFHVQFQKWTEESQQADILKRLENEQIWNRKVEKILNVLSHQNLVKIRQKHEQIVKNNEDNLTYNSLLEAISGCMQYRLTQRQIFQSLCFPVGRQAKQNPSLSQQTKLKRMMNLMSLASSPNFCIEQFSHHKKSSIQTIQNLYEQFQTFDLEHLGFLSLLKCEVVKRVVPLLGILQLSKYIVGNNRFYLQNIKKCSKQQCQSDQFLFESDSTIHDCKINEKQTKNTIDYLHLLWDLKSFYHNNFFNSSTKPKQPLRQKNNHGVILNDEKLNMIKTQSKVRGLPKFYRLSVKQFGNLKLNDIPCTLEFRLDNKKIFEPIYRCYSTKFDRPYPSQAVMLMQTQVQSYTINIYNRLVCLQYKQSNKQLYQHKLIQKIDLRQILAENLRNRNSDPVKVYELNCENLEGIILVQFQCFESKQQFSIYKKTLKKQLDLTIQDQSFVKKDHMDKINRLGNGSKIKRDKEISKLLERQFYEEELIEEDQMKEQKNYLSTKNRPRDSSAKTNISKNDKPRGINQDAKFIGDSVLEALNEKSSYRLKSQIQNRIKAKRQESLLEKTRKQWQSILEQSRVDKRTHDAKEKIQNHPKHESTFNVLKEQIDRDELDRKFTAFNKSRSDSSSEQSQQEDSY